MVIPNETAPALWGVASGAVAVAVIGFSFGGWTTSGKAEDAAVTRANDAVVMALAPICVDKFERAADARANLSALRKVDTWHQGDFVEKGGWATVPGIHSVERTRAVARACAGLLAPT
jgi:alpha/beta superfamily hydrolase